eukprot:s382_g11.t1
MFSPCHSEGHGYRCPSAQVLIPLLWTSALCFARARRSLAPTTGGHRWLGQKNSSILRRLLGAGCKKPLDDPWLFHGTASYESSRPRLLI